MVQIGYTMMCEQRAPQDLVTDVVLAEQAGFDFAVISDHYHPWLEAQGHGGYAWSVLGAAAARTERIPLMTYVTCPTVRYHPAIVAQKAATMALLSDGRFTLNLGAGERLNEHVVGQGWPSVSVRHQLLSEAVDVIRKLWEGGYVTHDGRYFQVDSARVFDLPETPIPLGVAVSGPESCRLAGEKADVMVAVEPRPELRQWFDAAGGSGKPGIAQAGCCYGPDPDAALQLAHEQFRWFPAGWKQNAELPNCVNFDAASQFVRPEDMADQVPHGTDVEPYVQAVKQFVDAGLEQVAFVQIGPDQEAFCQFFVDTLGPALRKEFGPAS